MSRNDDLPANWHWGGGEASRPLSERGYYQQRAYRVLPGSNQHVERYIEIVIDTGGMPPEYHSVEINYCTENGMEIQRHERIAHTSFRVQDRTDEESQEVAERQARNYAVDRMAELLDYEP